MPLSDITILITSFLRPGYLNECLWGCHYLKDDGCKVLVVDDSGYNYPLVSSLGEEHATSIPAIYLPFDSGLTVKRNAGVRACQTEYVFVGADDFDFMTKGFKEGLVQAAALLDTNPEIDLVGGRVDNNPYESNLEYDAENNVMRERRLVPDNYHYQKCDLVVNAFLARTSVLREVPWDEDVRPIGGEHGQFFWHMKKASKTTVILRGLNINTIQLGQGLEVQDPRYGQFRRRAFAAGHTIMLRKEGWKDWIGA